MKKIYTLFVLTLMIFSSCEKVVDIDVPSIEPKLIIDASFEVYFDETPISAKNVVKLTESADYFDEIIPVVTVPPKPYGLPIAITQSPTRALFESPKLTGINFSSDSICKTAKSI